MSEQKTFETPHGRKIAFHKTKGRGPGIVFLGGFRSDMDGTKAIYLESWAKDQGREFVRFDYSGHGQSSGEFEDGCIGDWAQDAADVLDAMTDGPQVLVGSSMGGWISLLLAKSMPKKIHGFVGIATAPDFTEDGFWADFPKAARDTLLEYGQLSVPSEYGEPLVITRKLIEDGRENLVLRAPLALPFRTRFLQGTADEDVSVETAMRLLDHVDGDDVALKLVKDADHRFSDDKCLSMITDAVLEVS